MRAAPPVGRRRHLPHGHRGIARALTTIVAPSFHPRASSQPEPSSLYPCAMLSAGAEGAERTLGVGFAHARPTRPAVVDIHVTRSLCPVAICSSRLSSTESTLRPWSQCPQESKIFHQQCREMLRTHDSLRGERGDPFTMTESHSTAHRRVLIPTLRPVSGTRDVFLDVLDEIGGGPDGLRERRVTPVDFRADERNPTAQSTEAATTLTPDGSPGTFADCPNRFPLPTDARSDPSTETKATGEAALGVNRGGAITDVSATLCGEWRMGGSGDGAALASDGVS